MDVMILGKSGIGTSKAVIKIKMTRENAAEFCELYLNDTSAGCVKKVLKEDGSRIRSTVSGNCKTGAFTDMYGYSYVFKGRNKKKSDNNIADYIIVNRKTGQVLDGFSPSGYGVAISVFEALCPRSLSALSDKDDQEVTDNSGKVVNNSVARGLTKEEEAAIEKLAANSPSPDELELVSGLSRLSGWAECLAKFEENLGYGEDGLSQTALIVDEKKQVGYQALSNEKGDNLVEARCVNGRYTFSAVNIVPFKK